MTDDQTARAIVEELEGCLEGETYSHSTKREMANIILSALAAQRERDAKVADGRQISAEHFVWNECCKAIAQAIRRGET